MTDTTAAVSTEGAPAADPVVEASTTEAEAGKSFTQADIDKAVSTRLAREAKKFADYDDIKARLKAAEDNAPDLDAAVTAARTETETALRAEFTRERVTDKVEALAGGKFADAEDAVLRLKDRADEFVKDGAVDIEAITKALDEVIEKHPHLAAEQKRKTPSAARAGLGVTSTGKTDTAVSPGYDRMRSAYKD